MNDGMTIKGHVAHGETILFAGTAVDVLVPATATGNAFSLLRFVKPSGCWTPPHLHWLEDETVYVLSGTVRALLPDGMRDLLPGQALLLPRGQPHRLGNVGPGEACCLVLCTPGGFDAYVRAAGRIAGLRDAPQMTDADVTRLIEAAPRHGIELLAPEVLEPGVARHVIVSDPPVVLDVLGLGIEVLAESGGGAGDMCLIRGFVPPGSELPLHGSADPGAIHILAGELQVASGGAGRMAVCAGETVQLPNGIPHVLQNRSEYPATILLVATRRMVGLFRKVGEAPGAMPPEPLTVQRPDAPAATAAARGRTRAGARE